MIENSFTALVDNLKLYSDDKSGTVIISGYNRCCLQELEIIINGITQYHNGNGDYDLHVKSVDDFLSLVNR